MNTGQLTPTDGLYRSDCGCRSGLRLSQGATAPKCPRCGGSVRWQFQVAFTPHPAPTERGMSASGRRAALLVEDNPADARLAQEQMRSAEFPQIEIDLATRLGEALERVKSRPYTVILLDLNLPDSRGLETAIRMLEAAPRVPVVVFTGLEDEKLGVLAIQEGAQDYLVKSQVSVQTLRRAVEYAIQRQDLAAHETSRGPDGSVSS